MNTAEDLGVTSKNIDEALKSKKPDVMRLVGNEGNYGPDLGLTKDWAVRIIKHVGNYGEVYERNVGSESRLHIPRGLNQLWNAGGIQYAAPVRESGFSLPAKRGEVIGAHGAIPYSIIKQPFALPRRDSSGKTGGGFLVFCPPC